MGQGARKIILREVGNKNVPVVPESLGVEALQPAFQQAPPPRRDEAQPVSQEIRRGTSAPNGVAVIRHDQIKAPAPNQRFHLLVLAPGVPPDNRQREGVFEIEAKWRAAEWYAHARKGKELTAIANLSTQQAL